MIKRGEGRGKRVRGDSTAISVALRDEAGLTLTSL
jgi:hypothetical protein